MPEQQELLDVLWDALDEYEASNCDLSTLATDVRSVVAELADHEFGPRWVAGLRLHAAELAALRDQCAARGAWDLTAAERTAADESVSRIRSLIWRALHPDPGLASSARANQLPERSRDRVADQPRTLVG